MGEVSLYRKWRSRIFDEVVGQPHITRTLKGAILDGKIAHAYLFCGPRGTGKTSTAKVLARTLNCEKGPTATPCGECAPCASILSGSTIDVIEMDAASNRGIDEVRDLREKVRFAPTLCRYKIYIIDEVHMLTQEAFNALLKTLEEPPPHVVFVLCTTEPHRLLPTVISRCQRFDFRRIPLQGISERVRDVARQEGIFLDEEALLLLAELADGSLRDALSLLDQARGYSGNRITLEGLSTLLGLTRRDFLSSLLLSLHRNERGEMFQLLDQIIQDGADLHQVLRDLLGFTRNLLLMKVAPSLSPWHTAPGSRPPPGSPLAGQLQPAPQASRGRPAEREPGEMTQVAEGFSVDELFRFIKVLGEARQELRWTDQPRLVLEMALLQGCLEISEIRATSARRARGSSTNAPLRGPMEPAPVPSPRSIPTASITPTLPAPGTAASQDASPPPLPSAGQSLPATAPGSEDSLGTESSGRTSDESSSPPVASPPVAAPPTAGSSRSSRSATSADPVAAGWSACLEKLKKSRPSLHAILLAAAFIGMKGEKVVLSFSATFHRTRVLEEKRYLEQLMKESFGHPCELHCVLREEPGKEAQIQHGAVLQQAVEMFGGTILDSGR